MFKGIRAAIRNEGGKFVGISPFTLSEFNDLMTDMFLSDMMIGESKFPIQFKTRRLPRKLKKRLWGTRRNHRYPTTEELKKAYR